MELEEPGHACNVDHDVLQEVNRGELEILRGLVRLFLETGAKGVCFDLGDERFDNSKPVGVLDEKAVCFVLETNGLAPTLGVLSPTTGLFLGDDNLGNLHSDLFLALSFDSGVHHLFFTGLGASHDLLLFWFFEK